MPKHVPQNKRSKLPFLIVAVLCGGAVWAVADYVKVAHADKVPAYEHRPTESTKPETDVTVSSSPRKTPTSAQNQVMVFAPVKGSGQVEFSSEAVNVPDDEDPKVFAVNELLHSLKVTDPDARLMSVEMVDSTAVLHFNAPMNHTMGEDDESYLVNGITKTMAQFPEVKKVQFYAEDKRIETFGSIDLSEPQPVGEAPVSARAKRSQTSTTLKRR